MKVNHGDLPKLRDEWREKRIVFCDGTFDLLHPAHIEHLKTLRTYGDILIVGVMSDAWVKMRKGNTRPILSQEERHEMIDAIRFVDYSVLLYDEGQQQRVRTSEALRLLHPDIFVTTDTTWNEKLNEFESLNIELKIVPPTPSATAISTTTIIQRILNLHEH